MRRIERSSVMVFWVFVRWDVGVWCGFHKKPSVSYHSRLLWAFFGSHDDRNQTSCHHWDFGRTFTKRRYSKSMEILNTGAELTGSSI